MNDKKDQKKENLKVIVALALLVAIFSGTFLVVWQIRQKNSPAAQSEKAKELEAQVSELNQKIDGLTEAINAAKEKVEVESSVEVTKSTGKVAGASTEKSESNQSATGIVNINTASATQLDSLDGIGATYAQRIIEYREANGGFKSIEEIKNVKGIGDKTFEKISASITI